MKSVGGEPHRFQNRTIGFMRDARFLSLFGRLQSTTVHAPTSFSIEALWRAVLLFVGNSMKLAKPSLIERRAVAS